ncbi:hypothetical protein AAG906_040698 [Vitis piasezkii]
MKSQMLTIKEKNLGDVIRQKVQKLDTPVLENGDNWSVGQRQLVSLGQALLKQATILVLDEATASVDTATDNLIQKIIRTEFQNCTVCTIAHRIPTVIDSDLVLVLSDGRVAEFDTPARLLEDKSSMFLKLVTEYSSRTGDAWLAYAFKEKISEGWESVVDLDIPFRLGGFASTTILLLGIVGVMTKVTWQVLLLVIPMAIACLWMQKYYMASSRELVCIVSIQKSPVIHLFGESIAGATTIRGFGQEKRFMKRNLYLLDCFGRPFFYSLAAIEWLCLRMELLSTFVFAFCMILLVSFPHGSIDPSMAGLAVTYGLNLNARLSRQIPGEAPPIIENSHPPSSWPENGTIELIDLKVCAAVSSYLLYAFILLLDKVRYKESLPVVLHSVTCKFPGGNKIGIVGRTGSAGGKIIIVNIDISTIGLHDIRSRLSIIPQDPTLLEGTIRGNLDPLEELSDQEIWQALDKSQLGDVIRQKEQKLDTPVLENGDNWSVGQRQLVSLGQALLKQATILVLDEATASIDTATDNLIQKIIRTEFQNCTVCTIAHRIPTIIDSDLVLVLSDGHLKYSAIYVGGQTLHIFELDVVPQNLAVIKATRTYNYSKNTALLVVAAAAASASGKEMGD